jgi:hypothetical protein
MDSAAEEYAMWVKANGTQETALGGNLNVKFIEDEDDDTEVFGYYDDFEIRVPRKEGRMQAWRGQMEFGRKPYAEDSDDPFEDGEESEDLGEDREGSYHSVEYGDVSFSSEESDVRDLSVGTQDRRAHSWDSIEEI